MQSYPSSMLGGATTSLNCFQIVKSIKEKQDESHKRGFGLSYHVV